MLDQEFAPKATNKLSSATGGGPVVEDAVDTDLGSLGNGFFQDLLGQVDPAMVGTGGPGLWLGDLARSALGGGDEEVCEPVAEICADPAVDTTEVVESAIEDPVVASEVACEEEPLVSEEVAPESEVCEASEAAVEELSCEEVPLTPEQQAAAAVQAREGLEAQITALPNVQAEQRAAILASVQGLEGPALVAQMRILSHALASPNADRALNTYADIQGVLAEDEDNAERLTPEIQEMLVNGVADRRTSSDRGQEGILNRRAAVRSARSLVEMTDEQYAATTTALSQAGQDADGNAVAGSDRGAEQALILKAVSARSENLDMGFWDHVRNFFGMETDASRSTADITQFASDIRGMNRTDLINQTTTIDLDDANTSTVDPDAIAANNDTRGDNDGLYQRWGDSCGPTTSQILRGEADPMYALRLHRGEGVNNADPNSASALEQKTMLENNGGVAVSRLGAQARTNASATMDQMRAANELTQAQRDAMVSRMNGQVLTPAQQTDADAALAAMRARGGGHPTDQELAAMQADTGKAGNGMVLGPALDGITNPATGLDYNTVGTPNIAGNMGDIEQRLLDGEDVPFRIGYTGGGGHFMSVTDVRRDSGGARSFLVSDPWSGATRWVPEADFTSGAAFNNKQFNLGSATVTHVYTDPATH